MASRKPRVLVICTGGAISAECVEGRWKYGEISGEKLLDTIPGIRDRFEIKTTNIFRMDSADMQPKQWLTIANYIHYSMKEFDGIVVTIGTDTMQYAAAAISFLIQDSNIPIVFTGSIVDPLQANTDVKCNLSHAITVAGESDIAETVIVFNGKIIRATRAQKTNASEYSGFDSIYEPQLGKIQHFIETCGSYRKRGKKSRLKLYNALEPLVATLKVYPGFDGNRLKHLVDYGVRGIVLEGYGLGNIPLIDNSMKEGILYANRKNVALVIASACNLGSFWRRIYHAEIGARLEGLKVIPVYDMLPETAYVKLMWAIAQTKKFQEVKKMMQKNYAGEISGLEAKAGGR